MDRRTILLGSLGFALPSATAEVQPQQSNQKRYALVLANEAYENKALTNILNDARAISRTLQQLGFDVTSGLDQSRSGMFSALRTFRDKLTPGCIALVYYSGHGAQVGGENYLIPVNNLGLEKASDLPDEAMPLGRILDAIGKSDGQLNLIILDACRDNPFPGAKSLGGDKGLAVVSRNVSGTLIAFAAGPGEVASSNPSGNNSLFTEELVKNLPKPSLRLEDVFLTTRKAVRERSGGKQIPQEYGSLESVVYLAGGAIYVPSRVSDTGSTTVTKRILAARLVSSAGKIRDRYPRVADYIESLSIIPAGDFQMGNNKEEDQAPVHKVSLTSFCMGTTPVTVAMWKEYATAKLGGQMPTEPLASGDDLVIKFNVGWKDLDHPIVNVSWEDCRKFCTWAAEISGLLIDLPSEAQWEYACRGGVSGQDYPWGGASDDISVRRFLKSNVWCSDDERGDRAGTGSVNRSTRIWRNHPWGLTDMVGNVQEWCLDWYDAEWYQRNQASGLDVVNRNSAPSQPDISSEGIITFESDPGRCCRGGSWAYNEAEAFRSSFRSFCPQADKNLGTGFRLASAVG